jgi:ketosteroid isomerase-like protein
MSYKEKIKDVYDLLGQGKAMDAFEKYYSEHVVMEELGMPPTKGKAVNHAREIEFFGTVQEVHGTGVEAITSDEENGITMVESWFDATYKNGQRINMEQVAVQRWEGGHIVYEKFYHK